MKGLQINQINQINFNYDKAIVEIYYTIMECHFVSKFSFVVWGEHNHFHESDLIELIMKHG